MVTRTRSRSQSVVAGNGTWVGTPISFSYPSYRERCDDVVGDYGGNHSLFIRKLKTTGSLYVKLTGSLVLPLPGTPTNWHGFTQSNWMPQPAMSSLVNRVLATTGPLTPTVNLPLALFELREIPKMLRHAGNLLHKIRSPSGLNLERELASANLAYKFGWAPIIQDLGKLLNFAESARRQQRNIKKALSSKGLRRRISLGEATAGHSGTMLVWSVYGQSRTVQYQGMVSSKSWATVTWVVRDPNAYGGPPSFTEALRTSLGFSPGQIPIQVWKALPWSWMIDWFTDISNILQANYNSIYFRPQRLSIMRHTTDRFEHRPLLNIGGDPNHYVTAGTYTAEFKERYALNSPTANVTLRVPFMDTYKMSVLGSLAILKYSPRYRRY